jgi:spoIIIJ-associated protein
MTSIEQTGRNVEEATRLALQKLGVTEDEVTIEILNEGSKGFLGIGQTPALVRVTLKEKVQEVSSGLPMEEEVSSQEGLEESTAEVSIGSTLESVEEKGEQVSSGEASEAETQTSEDLVREAAEISRDMLQHVIEAMGNSAKVVVKSVEDRQVVLDIVGGSTGLLIGKHGQTLNALQYLIGVATNKRLGGQVRIILDAEGYRQRREQALRQHALYLAEKVKRTGQEAVLDPLEAFERRIVHLALAEDPDVYTYSEGEEPERRVVISPRK